MCSFLLTNALVVRVGLLNAFMRLRGPDATSVTRVGGITFLHNLLHITGEMRRQPFRSGRVSKGGRVGRGTGEVGGGSDGVGGATKPAPGGGGQVLAVFNGEVYNYLDLQADAQSDGDVLLPLYLRYGSTFVRRLDGEFAIAIADFDRKRYVLATDPFGTKPLYYGRSQGKMADGIRSSGASRRPTFGAATYRSALASFLEKEDVRPVPPNTILVLDEDFQVLERRTVFEFDLRQFKKSYSDWSRYFEEAVAKRARPSKLRRRSRGNQLPTVKVFLGLSSGYDSGCLHSALTHLGISYTAYTMPAYEDLDLIRSRVRYSGLVDLKTVQAGASKSSEGRPIHSSLSQWRPSRWHRILQMSGHSAREEHHWALRHVEFARYMRPDENGNNHFDPAAVGLSAICRDAKKRGGHRVMLSAAGGDEIFSDYGDRGLSDAPIRSESYDMFGRFFGLFPRNLSSIFPWLNLFLGKQRNYLMKEETILGAHGLEGRYPFLDRRMAQEFLWLSSTSKNRYYKSPGHNYMAQFEYPFHAPLPYTFPGVDRNEFRRGFHATRMLLMSRSSSVTEFGFCGKHDKQSLAAIAGLAQGGCQNAPRVSCFPCWQRVVARDNAWKLAERRRLDVLHGCAVGRLAPLFQALRGCTTMRGRNETGLHVDPMACAEGYLSARRDTLSCLGFLQHSYSDHLIVSVLGMAELLGLCSGYNCICRASSRWGLSLDGPALPAETAAVRESSVCKKSENVTFDRANDVMFDVECGLECAEMQTLSDSREIGVAGPFMDFREDIAAVSEECLQSFEVNAKHFRSLSGRTCRSARSEKGSLFLVRSCMKLGGRLVDAWVDAEYLRKICDLIPSLAQMCKIFRKQKSLEQVESNSHTIWCVPASCLDQKGLRRFVWKEHASLNLGIPQDLVVQMPLPEPNDFVVARVVPLHGSITDAISKTFRVQSK